MTFGFHMLRKIKLILKINMMRNFHPSGLFDDLGNGARRLLTVEKEEASTSQAADLATTG